ncbi:MAG: ABC transporter permease [Thermoanaerobaculia bacterium]
MTPAAEPRDIPFPRVFFWTVRRELWENRSIYLAPLSVAALFLVGFVITLPALPARMRALSILDAARQQRGIVAHYDLAAALIMGAATIVAIFYCLDALHGERRDRSILFWKSLPVSDLTVVLAKASIPIVVLQLVSFAVVVATQLVMLLSSTAVLRASGVSADPLWAHMSIFRTWSLLLYHLISVHALWYAPIYAWLLFVSAWSRRAALLWAILPPFAICGLEKIVFNTTRIASRLGQRLTGGMEAVNMPGTFPMSPMNYATPGRFLTSPGLWIGLAVAAALLAATVQIRRFRGPL